MMNTPKMQWLDRALAGQPPETKAQVLDFCVRFGVDGKDDDFFVLIAAVGYLNQIVQSAPNDWQATLDNFREDLSSWTNTNLETLKAMADQAEASAQQAELTKDLITTLNEFTRRLNAARRPSNRDDSSLSNLSREFLNFREALNYQLNELKTSLNPPSTIPMSSRSSSSGPWNAIATISSNSNNRNPSGNVAASQTISRPLTYGIIAMLCILLTATGFSLYRLWNIQLQQTQQIEHLLEQQKTVTPPS
ncbi:MAG: DUF6753 family protein [Cyanobacteria bacterium P01_H01_bin.105]